MLEFILAMISLVLAFSFASLNHQIHQAKDSLNKIACALENIHQKE